MLKVKGQSAIFLAICLLTFDLAAAPLPGGKRDGSAPIEVTSDTLEVLQEQNRAVFSGHVVVIQGDVRLKADKMTVHYRASEEKDKAKAKDAKGPDTGAIQKIVADGNVFLSTAEETASGARGTYDVEHHEIRLNDKVVLTRGPNTLKGDALVYNFDTGKSALTSGGKTSEGGGGRVRALFVPEKAKKGTP